MFVPMHTHPRWIALGLLLTLAACGAGDEERAPDPSPAAADPIPAPTDPAAAATAPVRPAGLGALGEQQGIRTTQSACKQPGSSAANGSNLQVTLRPDGALEIVHLDVTTSCAAEIATTVKVTPPGTGAGAIVLEETITNPGGVANCPCVFDVSAVVPGLEPGDYQVSAVSPDGQLAGPVPASIPAAPLLPSLQSACKGSPNGNGAGGATLQASWQGGALQIEHLDVTANCASKLALAVAVTPASGAQPGLVEARDVITNPGVEANCTCVFDVSGSVSGLTSGTYQVTARDLDGNLSGPISVVVP